VCRRSREDDVVNISLRREARPTRLQRSQLLAESLLEYIVADRKLEDAALEARPGFVRAQVGGIPSVLVETAFINNPVEVKLLKDPRSRRTWRSSSRPA